MIKTKSLPLTYDDKLSNTEHERNVSSSSRASDGHIRTVRTDRQGDGTPKNFLIFKGAKTCKSVKP
jgi:hypothetical protein